MKLKTSLSGFPWPVLVLITAAFCLQGAVMAGDYYPPRVSYLDGRGAYEPAGDVDWDEVTVNLPLLNGDRVYSQADSRIEIDLGKANFLRLGPETDVAFVQVAEKETVLELHTGALILRINDSERFRVYTPGGPVFIQKKGLYRIESDPSRGTQVVVRKGRAEIETPQGKQKVNSGESAVLDPQYGSVASVSYGYADDAFDIWSDRRDARMVSSQSVAYVGGVYYPGIYDLDYYGSWVTYPSYGRVWVPHVSAGWVPFRNGFWVDFSFGWGWTWISYEPWGYLPYHYGAWRYYNSRWCWVPGGFNHWSPAPVHFYHHGGYVGWYPRSHWNTTYVNNTTIINNNTTVINNIERRGLTLVREGDFGRTRINQVALDRVPDNFSNGVRDGLPDGLRSGTFRRAQGDALTTDRGRSRSLSGRTVPGGATDSFTSGPSSRGGVTRSVTRTPSAAGNSREIIRSNPARSTPSARPEARDRGSVGRTQERAPVPSVAPSPRSGTARTPEVVRPRSNENRAPSGDPGRSRYSTPSPDRSIYSIPDRNGERGSSPADSSRYRTREMVSPPSAPRPSPAAPQPDVSRSRAPSRTWSTPGYRPARPEGSSSRSVTPRSSRPSPSISRPSPSASRPAPSVSRPMPSRPSYQRPSAPAPSRPSAGPSRPSSSSRPPRERPN